MLEADLPAAAQGLKVEVGYEYVKDGPGKILIGFVVLGPDGSEKPGERPVMFGQYDARSNAIAR